MYMQQVTSGKHFNLLGNKKAGNDISFVFPLWHYVGSGLLTLLRQDFHWVVCAFV